MAYNDSVSNNQSASTSSGGGSSNNYSTTTASSSSSRPTFRYSDLNLNMIPHPQKKDIIPVVGENAVKNAVRTLIVTNFFERPFQPNLGANLRSLLFEPADAITRLAIKDTIENILERHEPRIENINVLVATTHDETEYNIVVVFSIKENDSVQDVEINLRRLR